MRLGLLLPHFGNSASGSTLIESARHAEALGFHSLWVRDHLFPQPQQPERDGTSFLESLTVLSAVGASTESVQLGTGALVPFRHPIHLALIASTMTQLFGPRLILGMGTGSSDQEFEALGFGGTPRAELLEANVEILRRLWSHSKVSWHDNLFGFSDITLLPRPVSGSVPLWYCGSSPKGARVAAASYDGWLPGRIPLATTRSLIPKLEAVAAENKRTRPVVGMIPIVSVATTRETASAELNVEELLAMANRATYWIKPPSGRFETVEDLEGLVLHGTPEDILEQCLRLREVGVDHIVFDFRMSFHRWKDQVEFLAEKIIPELATREWRVGKPSST